MIKINLKRLFALRGIEKPMQYLMSKGMTYNRAYRLSRDNFQRYDNLIIEQLCVALNCTPNDLFDFTADKDYLKDETLEIHKLKKDSNVSAEAINILKTAPIEKVQQIYEKLKNES